MKKHNSELKKKTRETIIFYIGLFMVIVYLILIHGMIVVYSLTPPVVLCILYTVLTLYKNRKKHDHVAVIGLVVNNLIIFIISLFVSFVIVKSLGL